MDLTGAEFKELEVTEQVQIVNDLIEHGYSVERIRKSTFKALNILPCWNCRS